LPQADPGGIPGDRQRAFRREMANGLPPLLRDPDYEGPDGREEDPDFRARRSSLRMRNACQTIQSCPKGTALLRLPFVDYPEKKPGRKPASRPGCTHALPLHHPTLPEQAKAVFPSDSKVIYISFHRQNGVFFGALPLPKDCPRYLMGVA